MVNGSGSGVWYMVNGNLGVRIETRGHGACEDSPPQKIRKPLKIHCFALWSLLERPQDAPRRLKTLPRRPKTTPRRPKTAPRRLKTPPRWLYTRTRRHKTPPRRDFGDFLAPKWSKVDTKITSKKDLMLKQPKSKKCLVVQKSLMIFLNSEIKFRAQQRAKID